MKFKQKKLVVVSLSALPKSFQDDFYNHCAVLANDTFKIFDCGLPTYDELRNFDDYVAKNCSEMACTEEEFHRANWEVCFVYALYCWDLSFEGSSFAGYEGIAIEGIW